MNTKKLLALVLVLALVICTLPVVFADGGEPATPKDEDIGMNPSDVPADDEEEGATSGTEGDLSWELSEDGALSFTGTGAMADGSGLNFDPEAVVSVVVANSATSIAADAFSGCSNLVTVEIGTGVTEIGDNAFKDCVSLTEMKLKKVTTIGDNAFAGCTDLTKVRMGYVDSVGTDAFAGCSGVTLYCKSTLKDSENYDAIKSAVAGVKFIGDVTGDNNVIANDISKLLQYMRNNAVAIDFECADTTGDGNIIANDISKLLQYLRNNEVDFG